MQEQLETTYTVPENSIEIAAKNIQDILTQTVEHTADHTAMVVYDSKCPLAVALTEGYRRCLPSSTFIDFYAGDSDEVIKTLSALKPADLVVLIQTSSFRMNAFRLRVDLFSKSIKVIEHPHLGQMIDDEAVYYIESLAYDPTYYRGVGRALKKLIDEASSGAVDSDGELLTFSAPFELAKLNIGDYSEMKNIGGQFPIGEVFTEARDLATVNGRVRIFAFGDTTFSVNKVEKPITLVIEEGQVVEAIDSTPEFDKVLANIRKDEEVVWLRELGFGMNRAFTQERTVKDIGSYERMCGIHLSLGAKHGVYKKAHLRRADTWHHVDVFAVTKAVTLDEQVVYEKGEWQV